VAQQALPLVGEQNLLFPLLQQVNSLQQQMFEQFQQTLVMLFRMMSSMQQEQVALIRDELRQFQKATEELNRLQVQVSGNRAGDVPRSPATRPEGPTQAPVTEQSALPPLTSPASSGPNGTGDGLPNGNVHDWLTQRIDELQNERQGSWQRILGFIRGG
jgi:hypothetical protein